MASCVDVGGSVYHARRYFGACGHIQNKCCIGLKGLSIFNNQITFWFWGFCTVQIALLMLVCVCTWYGIFWIVKEFVDILATCTTNGTLVQKG